MTDIRSLGSTGQAVFDTASRIKEAGLIDEAKFKELTNTNVGRQDVAIGNEALNALQANTPDAKKLLFAIPKMNNDIMTLQLDALKKKTVEAPKAENRTGGDATQGSGTSAGDALRQFLDLIASSSGPSAIRNIRQ